MVNQKLSLIRGKIPTRIEIRIDKIKTMKFLAGGAFSHFGHLNEMR